jgi:hypothetical protein
MIVKRILHKYWYPPTNRKKQRKPFWNRMNFSVENGSRHETNEDSPII